jgi:hypothetical protein
VLNAAFPCGLLSPTDPLITGTLKYMNRHISKTGLQMHTGWMADGMWVAISLDNVAEAELARDNGDEAVRLLYASLNHGTPLYTWCEERGEEAGSEKTSGDRQHLWTPAAVIRAVRDCMVFEKGDELHLGLGAARQWLEGGQPVGVKRAPTHFGEVSYQMRYDSGSHQVTGSMEFFPNGVSALPRIVMHVRLPGGLNVKSVNEESGATVLPDRGGITWHNYVGKAKFIIEVK